MNSVKNLISDSDNRKSARQTSLLHKLAWLGLGFFCIVLSLLAFVPADCLAVLLERQTEGRLTLGDAQGSLWSGSAFIGAVAGGSGGAIVPLLPGRFVWHLSPAVLLGQVEMTLENTESLQHPIYVSGSWNQIQVSASAITVPTERLAGMGAPLNTLRPSGQMILSWNILDVALSDGNTSVDMNGSLTLTMQGMASALSPVKPLGSYLMTFDCRGTEFQLKLYTTLGPLLLQGRGTVVRGHLQFSGQASAENGQEEKLANLLNLLGQRHMVGDKNVTALEFK